ncbi:MAG: hypothetical protein NVS2B3_05800 [Vulcanimicrobiaceae bacterium]
MKIAPFALGLALFVSGATVLSAAPPKHVTYSASQAAQGRTLYYGKCAMCHGANLEGISGPALKGPDSNLKAQTVSAVYTYTTVQMPVGNAGGLPKGDYVKLMAFILQNNGVPAGPKAATAESLKANNADIGKAR